ncbi:alpha/beta family hydrolase [Agrobacterium sp. NPDC090283]|uniref:alpha/beta hydrolase family protein n=1 Tax=Agrobacterium sp. NPDC090283 TaxID=3363920 RepID=UPI00383BA7F3
MPHDFLVTGPEDANVTVVLAHGAGGAMDTTWMTTMSAALSDKGLRIVRFEFDYMAARRSSEKRAPPPRAEVLKQEFEAVIDELGPMGRVVIGGKSMGGRVASMIAEEDMKTPTLICQGTRDLFGSREEVPSYKLSDKIEILWLDDGDHDFRPRKAVSGRTAAEHISTAADHVAEWAATL